MEDFQFETKIREIVYQISQPTMMRCTRVNILVSDCMRQLDVQQLNIDNLKQQLRQMNENQQNNQNEANRKYGDVDNLQRQQKKLEQDVLKNLQASQQYTSNLKARLDAMDQDFEQHKNNAQFVINSQLKTQQELDQLAKKQAENTETFNKKIDEFFKDYYTFFVDSRNQVNKISKEYHLLSKDVAQQGNQLEQLGIFREGQIQQNSSLQQRVEWISNEIPSLVNKEFFRFTFDKEEKSRIEDIQLLKCQVQQLQNQVQIYNVSFDERMKSFELYEIQYRQQLNSFQSQLNQIVETYQNFYKETMQTLSEQQNIIKVIEQYQANVQDKIQMIVNAQMNVISVSFNNQIKGLKEQFIQLKSGIAKDMSTEFNYKLDDIRQTIINDMTQQITAKLLTLEQQLNSVRNSTVQKDVAVQVIIDESSISQQEQLQNYIIEQIESRIANVSPKTLTRPVQRRNSLVRQEGPQKVENQKIPSLNIELEDIRTDIQLLFEMREELEEKFKVFEADFSVGMQNFDRNHSQVLKLKSDIFNDTEYLNNQTKILFREKETTNRKFNQVLQLLAGQAEAAQIIISFLLRQLKDPIKFTSDLGVVFEQRNDISNYRQSTYQIEDLLKKCFQSIIDLWDKNEMLEVREFHPLWYFNKFVVKQTQGLSRTLDKSLERTIKCTTQTMVDGDESIRRSGRQRNFSQKQTTIESTRHKKMTVRSMFRESNDGLPKMKK